MQTCNNFNIKSFAQKWDMMKFIDTIQKLLKFLLIMSPDEKYVICILKPY